ncbi:insecticidal delta-endotoxin Cry8Ea1 family protein [Bacillus thuringiensis]|uniref:insecticidal delta-endotoxin Cry8Ea1 family protein n=1 Tax=Bacillus thuringiensis TaxID=1428 RepID=UPI001065CBF8|nr:insecticidal delta-endotoxin Cry8Ea1 family protein [Bacillus thuringiensis]TEA80813.1 hypothetical protein PBMB05447_24225 [Bacillus thuringiensis F14-1]
MATLNELYPVPYNVLAHPPLNLQSNWDEFMEIFNGVKDAWGEFQKTGVLQKTAIEEGIKAAQGGSINYLALIKASFSIVGLIVPGGEVAVPFLNMFADFAWSHLFPKKGNQEASILNMIDEEVNRLLNKRLNDVQLDTVNKIMNGFKDQVEDLNSLILKSIFDTNQNPKTPTGAQLENIYTEYKLDTGLIGNDMYEFILKDYEEITLPMYVMAITLKLMTHHTFIKYADKWVDIAVFDSPAKKDVFKDNLELAKDRMRKDIKNATNHVTQVIKDHEPSYTYNSKDQLNAYIRYHRHMTLNCLDFVAMWPTLVHEDYPNGAILDLTRIIFGDIIGPTEDQNLHFNLVDIHGKPIENNDIFNYFYQGNLLNKVRFQSARYSPSSLKHCIVTGFDAEYTTSYTMISGDSLSQSDYYTGYSDTSFTDFWENTHQQPITNMNMNSQNTIYLDYTGILINDDVDGYRYTFNNCDPWNVDSPASKNTPYQEQRVQAIYPIRNHDGVWKDGRKSGFLYTLIPNSVDVINHIGNDPITNKPTNQTRGLPAEKGYIYQGNVSYINEPTNGAAAVKMETDGMIAFPFINDVEQEYQIRLRYYCYTDHADAYVSLWTYTSAEEYSYPKGSIKLPATNGYELYTFEKPVKLPARRHTMYIHNTGYRDLFIDRIEFVPVVDSPSGNNNYFTLSTDLQNITTQVNALFASGTQNALAKDVSDYWIEQVVLKVDALSDEVFGKEKEALRKLVNQAKRLSKARNLLIGGSFDNLDAWYRGRNVVIVSDHELFKSDHILLPDSPNPSYIFQKVEESKLKPNTRYIVSGFIAEAEHLEIVVSRYGQEIKRIVQIPYGEALPLSSGPTSSCCTLRPTENGKQAGSHFFNYSIDVGALDLEANLGIEFGFRIVKRAGMARLGNLEIREDRPLTANEVRKVQRAARDWKAAYEKERAEVTALIQPVLNQINALYENEDWNGAIRSDISYHDIESIVLPTLPKLNHWFMSDMLGEQGSILAQFQEALDRAYTQLEGSTLLHNGHFTTDAANWTIEGDAHQVVLEDGRRVLRLPDWSSSVSQTIEIENFDPDKEYQLVFHAQGEGTVSLQHGEEGEYVETHTHKFANFTTSQRQGVTFETNKVTVEIASEDGEFLVDHIALVEAPLPTDDQSSDGNTTSNTNSNTSMNNNQ